MAVVSSDAAHEVVTVTPEGLVLAWHPAGAGRRLAAALVDGVIVAAAAAVAAGVVRSTGDATAAWLAAACTAVLLPPAAEVAGRGQTPGKAALRLRVVAPAGGPASPLAIVVRNLLRPVDAVPPVGMVAMLLSPRSQRLGDLAAGTVVIVRPPARGAARMGWSRWRPMALPPPSGIDISGMDEDELALIRRFLLRRPTLQPAARAHLALQLHDRIAPRVPGSAPYGTEQLLDAVAIERAARPTRPRQPPTGVSSAGISAAGMSEVWPSVSPKIR